MSISDGLRGELGAVRVERSSSAPLGRLRRGLRGVDGVELMLVCMYTVRCGCWGASRGVAVGTGDGLSERVGLWEDGGNDGNGGNGGYSL